MVLTGAGTVGSERVHYGVSVGFVSTRVGLQKFSGLCAMGVWILGG